MKDEKKRLRAWAQTWKETGKFLEELRRREMRETSLPDTLLALSDACESALRLYPPQPTSGLIEMQKGFRHLRKNETDS